MYTIQIVYLTFNPIQLNHLYFICTLILGIIGYIIFRLSNYQKDSFRENHYSTFFGIPNQFLKVKYKTLNNQEHTSKLLISGFWGISRHSNYLGDIILSLCFCIACGFDSIIPYFYVIYIIMRTML